MDNAYLQIDLNQLHHNIEAILNYREYRCPIIAVLKTNAYGCGMVEISRELDSHRDICMIAVSHLSEALTLRQGGVKKPVLVLTYTKPELAYLAVENDIVLTVVSSAHAQALDALCLPLRVHVKVDTGLHRYGIENLEELRDVYQLQHLRFEGIFTHFASAESYDASEIAFTYQQKEHFDQAIAYLESQWVDVGMTHTQNTPSFFHYPEFEYDAVRMGMALLGVAHPSQYDIMAKAGIKPIFSGHTLVSKIETVKAHESVGYLRSYTAQSDEIIAIIACGYSELLPRNMYQKEGFCIINGKPYPYIANDAMSASFVRVDHSVHVNDPVILFDETVLPFYQFLSFFSLGTNEYTTYLNPDLERIYCRLDQG